LRRTSFRLQFSSSRYTLHDVCIGKRVALVEDEYFFRSGRREVLLAGLGGALDRKKLLSGWTDFFAAIENYTNRPKLDLQKNYRTNTRSIHQIRNSATSAPMTWLSHWPGVLGLPNLNMGQ
jgi:hypothetical protein